MPNSIYSPPQANLENEKDVIPQGINGAEFGFRIGSVFSVFILIILSGHFVFQSENIVMVSALLSWVIFSGWASYCGKQRSKAMVKYSKLNYVHWLFLVVIIIAFFLPDMAPISNIIAFLLFCICWFFMIKAPSKKRIPPNSTVKLLFSYVFVFCLFSTLIFLTYKVSEKSLRDYNSFTYTYRGGELVPINGRAKQREAEKSD
jgi:hypothetical protein